MKAFPFAFQVHAEAEMTEAKYKIVEHDGGWAYKLGDVFSETFPTHEAALRASRRPMAEAVFWHRGSAIPPASMR